MQYIDCLKSLGVCEWGKGGIKIYLKEKYRSNYHSAVTESKLALLSLHDSPVSGDKVLRQGLDTHIHTLDTQLCFLTLNVF